MVEAVGLEAELEPREPQESVEDLLYLGRSFMRAAAAAEREAQLRELALIQWVAEAVDRLEMGRVVLA